MVRPTSLSRNYHLCCLLKLLLLFQFLTGIPSVTSRLLQQDVGEIGQYFYCRHDSDCKSISSTMYCNTNNPAEVFCDCNIFHTWSIEHHKCVGLVNTSCARGNLCASHSYCDSDDWCQCDDTHSSTKDRRCLLKFGSPCDPSSKAIDTCNIDQLLLCNYMTKRCDCQYPDQMKYDENLGECRMLVNEPCDPFQTSFYQGQTQIQRKCVQGALCYRKRFRDRTGFCLSEPQKVFDPITVNPILSNIIHYDHLPKVPPPSLTQVVPRVSSSAFRCPIFTLLSIPVLLFPFILSFN